MKSSLIPTFLALTLTLPLVQAWGQLPHRTIALLSTRFLFPETVAFIRTILPQSETIPDAALWSDYFSHTNQGRWSGALHYIDSKDDPSNGQCSVIYDRDCKNGDMCVVGAIVNVTLQLSRPDMSPVHSVLTPFHLPTEESDSRESKAAQESPTWSTPAHLALRFLLHFIGDIHQPLHTENVAKGGNAIHVRYHGRDANLHSVWDSLIPQDLRHGHTARTAVLWADELHRNITSFPPETLQLWSGNCFKDVEALVTRADDGAIIIPEDKVRDCALEWARWANKYVCEYVFEGQDVDDIKGKELSGKYTEGARELVDELVGMAGWRLGGWLNLVVTGRLGLGLGLEGEGHGGSEKGVVGVDEL